MLFVVAAVLAILPEGLLRQAEAWRPEMQAAAWSAIGLLAVTGAALRIEGAVSWCPVFGLDGPTLPMLVLLAFAGGIMSQGRRGMACVLAGLAFLALSPLVFGLLAGTALVLLAGKGRQGVWLPAAVVPACIPADSPLCPPLLCLMVLLLGWSVSAQKGPEATVPVGIGVFLLGRLLSETGVLHPVFQVLLILSGCCVALGGCVQALRARQVHRIAAGLACAGFGALVVLLALALATTLEGMDQFRTAAQLGLGAPLLGMLALLWLCQPPQGAEESSESTRLPPLMCSVAGLAVLSVALLLLSGLPPLGGFSVLWCLVSAGELATRAAPPIQALGTILVLVGAAAFMALGILGLVRLGYAAFRGGQNASARLAGQSLRRGFFPLLPAVVCLVAACLVSVLPGAWLALQDHLFVGVDARDFLWSKVLSVWFTDTPVSFTPLYSVAALTVCVVGVIALGRVCKFYPFPRLQAARQRWQEGAPLIQQDKAAEAEPTEQEAAVWTMLLVFLGLQNQRPSDWPIVGKTAAGGRYVQAVLFRSVAWCEAQGLVLILFFLAAGLLFGLLVGQ